MKDFLECLVDFSNKVNKFMDKYKIADESVFTPELTGEILKNINDFETPSSNEISLLEKRRAKLADNFKSILKDYYKEEKNKKAELKTKLKELKDTADLKTLELKNELSKKKKEFEKFEYDTLNDIDFYIESSNQNIFMFEIEHKDSLNRFAYQIAVAKSSYNFNIDTFNSQLEAQLEKITSNYKDSIESCDKSFNELVESYNLIINEKNKVIDNKKEEYHVAQVELKTRKRQESIELNNLIRQYSDEKNDKLDEFKNVYISAQRKDNEERKKLSNQFKVENLKLNRNFVTNIREIDSKIKDIREEYEAYCTNENQIKYYSIFNLHKEEERATIDVYSSNNPKYKNEIKRLNKIYYKKMLEESNKCEKLIQQAKKNYISSTNENSYQKKLLDITRTTSFNKLNEKQIRDNKYFQELSNRYENQYNYDSFVAINEYNKYANKILLDSSIRNLGIEKELDETDARYQIQIETLVDVIKKYQLEINIASRLNKLNHYFLDEKYNKEVSFLTVSNLLKIEKCKVLDQYNYRQYELNLENSNNILEYSKNKIGLQNDKYSALKKQDVVIASAELHNFTSKNSYDSYVINSKCLYEQDMANINLKFETNLNKNDLLREKFIVELDEYENILQTYIILYSNAIKLWDDLLDLLFDSTIDIKDKLLITFFDGILEILKEYLVSLTNTYEFLIDEEISGHINFDNDFKYKESFNTLTEQKASEIAIHNNKKNMYTNEMNLLISRNDDLRLRLFTLQYENSKNRAEKADRRHTINTILNELKNNNKQLNSISIKISEVENDISVIEKKYKKKFDILLKEQEIDNTPYQLFNSHVSDITKKIIENINSQVVVDNLSKKEKYHASLINLNANLLTSLFMNNSTFSEKYQESYNLAVKKINDNYTNELDSMSFTFNNNYTIAKQKYTNNNLVELERIKNLVDERESLEKKYNKIIKENDSNHKLEISRILEAKKNSTNQFYTELYAVSDNLSDIEKDYYANVKIFEDKYENDKQTIIDETLKIKDEYNQSLKNYILNRKAIIHHLPIAIKENEKELIADYKEKNKDLDLKLVQFKKETSTKNNLIKKNLNNIELNYKAALIKIDAKEKIQKSKERKNYNTDSLVTN